jgi:hypothetical protein
MGVWLSSMIVWVLTVIMFSMFIFFPKAVVSQKKAVDPDWVALGEIENGIRHDIEKMRNCQVDEECILIGGSCPFGIGFINRTQADLFVQKVKSYEQAMHARGKQCIGEWQPSVPAVCRSGKCVARECELDKKYEQMSFTETPCFCPSSRPHRSEQKISNDGRVVFECVQYPQDGR